MNKMFEVVEIFIIVLVDGYAFWRTFILGNFLVCGRGKVDSRKIK